MTFSDQKQKTYLITGASSGLGNSVAKKLLQSKQNVILSARSEEPLKKLKKEFYGQVHFLTGDVTKEDFINKLVEATPNNVAGLFVNAGGPPAATIRETTLSDWDNAYNLLVRWKVQLIQGILPKLIQHQFGRVLFSESTSITKPVQNLVLSNSLRMAIVGFCKTLALENQNSGITFNVLAPGYHETKAVERLYKKLSEQNKISIEEAKKLIAQDIPTGTTGSPDDYASLAQWFLTGESNFITGQVINIDGGTSI